MKIFTAIAAAGLLLTSATAAEAQRHDGRADRGHHGGNWGGHHGGNWGHNGGSWGHHGGGWGRHCYTQWRHHHRVRVCR